jgi:hypothetical protein
MVKFTNQEVTEDTAFLIAQVAGNEVAYSVLLTKVRKPLSREEVESHFEGELSKTIVRRSSNTELIH